MGEFRRNRCLYGRKYEKKKEKNGKDIMKKNKMPFLVKN
jgi:hypothetical protein